MGIRNFLSTAPLSLLLYADVSTTDWVTHYQDRTAAGFWSREERELYINVVEMVVVQLALNVFLPRILGVVVVLMSNKFTVVASQKKQGGTASSVMCSLAHEIVALTELPLGDLVRDIHSEEVEHSSRPVELSRPGPSHGMVSSSPVCSLPSVKCLVALL